ncbi:hypothetical protein Misp02_26930 [Microtetraspora sp. NBRC 16547]|nr:hypothetical protein Misp02_26930 [Microtetraspora sp. NBRC 16547]
MTRRNVAGSHDRCYPRVLVQLGTAVADLRPRCKAALRGGDHPFGRTLVSEVGARADADL